MRRAALLLALGASLASAWIAWRWWPALVSLLGKSSAWIAAAESAALLACLCAAFALRRSERAPGAAALVRVCCTGIGLAWSAFVASVPTYKPLWLQLALGPAAGCVALALLFELLSARWRPGLAKFGRVLLVTLALTPLLTELALRVVARARPSQLFARDERAPGRVLQRNRMSHDSERFGTHCNSGGHYDEEFHRRAAGEQLAAMIGDSFSQGIVPHELHYSTLAENLLGFKIDNLGISGVGPLEYEELLVSEALPLDPSAVVVSFFIGNDFELPPEEREPDPGLSAWLDRRRLLVWLLPKRLASIVRERRENPAGIAGKQAESDPVDPTRSLEERYPWLGNPRLEPASISRQGFLGVERSRANNVCLWKEEVLMRAVHVLERMRDECEGRPFGVLLIPDEFQIEDELWKELALPAELERDRPQRFLQRELGKLGIPVLDLRPVLLAVEPLADGKRHLYHLRDSHWNTRGNRCAAPALAEFVKTLLAGATSARR